MNVAHLRIRSATATDLPALARFRCSAGDPWEDLVEHQVRGPLPRRYLASPPRFDGRLLVGTDPEGKILVVGAHHIEPTLVPDVGYTEVIAVALDRRRTLVELPGGETLTLGATMLYAVMRQMSDLGRHRRTFVRVDRRNHRSLALCDRVGLREERPDAHDPSLVQRWGTLPSQS